MTTRFEKDPYAVLDYSVDWTGWMPDQDAISTSTWRADTGISLSSPSVSGHAAIVWISGGTLNRVYGVTNQIVTEAGRIDERQFFISIKDK